VNGDASELSRERGNQNIKGRRLHLRLVLINLQGSALKINFIVPLRNQAAGSLVSQD